MATNETFDAIITEMRHRSQEAYEGQLCRPDECWEKQIDYDEVDDWIDRIEAALARERETADLRAIHAAEMAERESRGEWRKICASCAEGTPPERCAYYGEPDGCNAPVRGHHPAGDVAERLKDELADAHDAIARLEAELAEARRERDTACAEHALSAAPGNAAATRNALKNLIASVDSYLTRELVQRPTALYVVLRDASHALASPARNCDVRNANRAWSDFLARGNNADVSASYQTGANAAIRWLYAAAEGGAE